MRRSLIFAVAVGVLLGHPLESAARQWKASKARQALEYVQIQYHKPGNEFVFVQWMAPTAVESTPQNATAREILTTYVLISVAHAHINNLGQWNYTDPTDVVIETGNSKTHRPVSPTTLPPAVSGFLTAYSRIIADGIGRLGKNMVTLVFANTGISDCREGVFWVRYAGERFEYKTPIPGCD